MTGEPLSASGARAALARQLPGLDAYLQSGQLEILDAAEWYLRDEVGADAAIERWLRRETEALRRGFAGLRISGNTQWLQTADEYARFAQYEARAHQAFQGRKIVALCSYALDRCRAEAMVDVVRNHKLALVRRGGEWDVVRSATTLMVAGEHAGRGHADSHLVHLYDRHYPAPTVARFLGDSLRADGAALVIATRAHNDQILAALEAVAVDVGAAQKAERLVVLDAAETLQALLFDGRPSRALVQRQLGTRLAALTGRFAPVHAFGEMVDLLAARGQAADAIVLEDLWNGLLVQHPVRLLCSYNLASFDGDADADELRRVCETHGRVVGASEVEPVGHEHVIAELQQKTRLLRLAAEQATRLQEITAALAETNSVDEVARVLGDVADGLGARTAILAHAGADAAGLSAALRRALEAGEVSWPQPGGSKVVALPAVAGGRRLGAIELEYAGGRAMSAAVRALHEDLARQVGVALDRALLHEEADRQRQRAEESSRAKDEFLAMLGHELRNPLSPIATALHLMRLRGEDVMAKERAVIERHVSHMGRLVDDLLDVSRIARGKVELKRRPVELAEAVALAIEQASHALEERAHRLSVSVPSTGLVVDADPARLAQSVANLLHNAAKYTGEGGQLSVAARREGDEVVLDVEDNGIGIDPELLPRVFELFVQGRRSHEQVQGGLGLGLALVKNLVELHGGRISAHSNGREQGSRFTMRMPLLCVRAGVAEDAGAAPTARPTEQSRHVLVVDDNADAAELLGELLCGAGHTVSVALDGPSALVAVRRQRPDVAILDIGLPVMDGYELAGKLRAELGAATPYLIALTGYGQTSDRLRSAESGFDEHLVKPVDPMRISELVCRGASPPK